MHVNGKEEMNRVWKSHFQCTMNEKTVNKAIMLNMRVEASEKHVCVQK